MLAQDTHALTDYSEDGADAKTYTRSLSLANGDWSTEGCIKFIISHSSSQNRRLSKQFLIKSFP